MRSVKSPSKFNLIFTAVLSLTLTSGSTAIHLANQPTLSEAQERVLDSALTLWTMGSTTVVGLLGSRRDDDDSGKDESDDEA